MPLRSPRTRARRPYNRHSQLAFEPLESRWLFSAIGGDDVLLSLSQPTGHAVFQRDGSNRADMTVAGQIASQAVTRIEARAVSMPGFSGSTTDWQVIDTTLPGGDFSGSLTVTAGWYAIEVRAWNGGAMVAAASVEQVGVGEVFVTAGQSNAGNYSPYRLTPSDPRVSAYGPDGWQFAADPQPIAGGTGANAGIAGRKSIGAVVAGVGLAGGDEHLADADLFDGARPHRVAVRPALRSRTIRPSPSDFPRNRRRAAWCRGPASRWSIR